MLFHHQVYMCCILLFQTLPCLVRMCNKERLLEERVEGAETLAYLIEPDVELQRIASITDHLISMLADYFKYPSSVSAITDIKRVCIYDCLFSSNQFCCYMELAHKISLIQLIRCLYIEIKCVQYLHKRCFALDYMKGPICFSVYYLVTYVWPVVGCFQLHRIIVLFYYFRGIKLSEAVHFI